MKKVVSILSAMVLLGMVWGCSDTKDRYIDLSTGKAIELEKDGQTGIMVNKETGEPVYIYVDTKNKDTIYGKTGKVINGHVVLSNNNSNNNNSNNHKYVYDEDEKLEVDNNGGVEYKDGDYKVEVEKDGDIKIKNGNKKVKIDGETGERKTKND